MQPNAIEITDSDIEYAEKILLKEGFTFDEMERRPFIKDLRTIDLQAVPGSGKTTVLLAKLLILERYLPFDNGSGILVASHTNAAVDEIKERIGKYCPKLFNYPNFIGTIQSLVDEFLAIPFYHQKTNKRIVRIDNTTYEDYCSNYSFTFLTGFSTVEQNNAKRYLRSDDLFKKVRWTYIGNNIQLTKHFNGNILDFKKPKGNTLPKNYFDWSDHEKKRVKEWILKFKKEIYEKGIMCFDDAYVLAFGYLNSNFRIKKILQKRFCYVFVDEMQDMDKHQHDILEEIFWNGGDTPSVYQRIGDKNQAIFNGEAKIQEIWTERPNLLPLTQSHRLSPKIADIVKNLTLSPIDVVGCNKNFDGSEIDIKPHIIIYTDVTIGNCIEKFTTIIKSLEDADKIGASKRIYRAIAWNTTEPEIGKIKLNSYFNFSRDESKLKIDYSNLDTYLCVYDKTTTSLKAIRTNILNAFLKILRIEKQLDSENRNFTKRKLLKHLSENLQIDFETFKLNIFKWSLDIVKGQKDEVLTSIKAYLPKFLNFFNKTIKESKVFIETPYDNTSIIVHTPKKINYFTANDIDVEVCTVHSVKGQTHTATLYLETFYKTGGGNYESERLANQLKGSPFKKSKTDVINQSVKMLYVGFSRPTHLLCFAVHKSRFDSHLSDIDRDVWEVVEV